MYESTDNMQEILQLKQNIIYYLIYELYIHI